MLGGVGGGGGGEMGARTIELIFDDGLSTPYGVGRACLLEVCGQLLATRLVSVGVADLT